MADTDSNCPICGHLCACAAGVRTHIGMKHPEARTPVATRPRTDIWPSERTARLIELWPSDLSASAIAIELGVTKNAVIGKADRLIDDRILFPKPTYSYLRALSGEQREQLMAELNAGLEERPLGR